MTTPEVDQELERLFSVAREATAPDAGARERIATGLAARLASGAQATRRPWQQRAWLGLGVTVLAVCGVALWLTGAPRAKDARSPVATPAPILAPALAATPASASAAPGLEVTPPAAPAPVSAPAASSKATQPAPSLEASKPAPSSAHGADPAEELPLVRAMQQALRSGNPGQALALAADHARRFPRGNLAEEREGVRAVAQCQLAAPGARAAILDAFSDHFATSPYAARVKAACR